MDLTTRADDLVEVLRGYGRTMVAFSGGVDSSVVVAAAARALGRVAAARAFCDRLGVPHHTVATRELDRPGYRDLGFKWLLQRA